MEPCKKRENRIRFGIIGSGWRALFYVRAAKALPERFELTGVVCHTKDKAQAFAAEHGVFASASLEELLKTQPEFVICCVNKDSMAGIAARLLSLIHISTPQWLLEEVRASIEPGTKPGPNQT